jgi:xylulokinase
MDSLIGLDLGTTAIKAGVYALDGRLLASAAFDYDLITPRPGWVEQDPRQWWDLSARAVRAALASCEVGHRPAAISVSSQGISFIPLDRTGQPLGSALCWLDMRADVEAAAVRARIGEERLFALTGKRPSAGYVLPKLLWLRRHEPERFRQADCFLTAHDFLVHRLCGAKVTDFSLAGGSLLFDLQRLEWSAELLDAFDLDPARLPRAVLAGTPAGVLERKAAEELDLPLGLPVVVGGQDQKVAALGAGLRPGWAAISLGTAAAVSCLAERPVLDPQRRIPLFPFVAPGLWDLEGVIGTAGAAMRWARDNFFPDLSYPQMDALARLSSPGANGVRFYPHLAGATSPLWQPAAAGAFSGLSLACGRADLARSLYEGVAYQIRANLEVMAQLSAPQALILFGGGSRSPLWREIIAAVCALPAASAAAAVSAGSVSASAESSAPDGTYAPDVALWGACRLAGFGAGLFAERFGPSAGLDFRLAEPDWVARYAELYPRYRAAERAPLV